MLPNTQARILLSTQKEGGKILLTQFVHPKQGGKISKSSSKKLFPILHLYYKLATFESSSEKALSRTTCVLQTGHF